MATLILNRKFKIGRILHPTGMDSMTIMDLLMIYLNLDNEYHHLPEVHTISIH